MVTAMTLKFSAERDALAHAFATAARASKYLYGILIDVSDGQAMFTSTDMNLTIETTIEVDAETTGKVHVPARLAAEVAKALPAGRVTIEETDDGKSITLTAGAANFSLRTLDAAEFPVFSPVEGATLSLHSEALLSALRRVLPAASTDDARPILNGILFASHFDGGLRLVATDSYRLAIADLPGEPAPPAACLVPALMVSEAVRHFDKADDVTITLGEREVMFDLGTVRVRSNLIEGEYPPYERLIQEVQSSAVVNRQETIEVLSRVNVVASQGTATPVRVEPADDEFILTANVADVGVGVETTKVTDYEGQVPAVAFNPAYLIQGLEACPGEMVRFGYTGDSVRPVLLASPDDPTFLYLLMPVRAS